MAVRTRLLGEDDTHCRLCISVEDAGTGIPAQAQKKGFEQFSQLDGSTTRQYGGTGLGLAICRRLVGLMGGVIGLDSEAGEGAHFHIELRLREQSPAEVGIAMSPSPWGAHAGGG